MLGYCNQIRFFTTTLCLTLIVQDSVCTQKTKGAFEGAEGAEGVIEAFNSFSHIESYPN